MTKLLGLSYMYVGLNYFHFIFLVCIIFFFLIWRYCKKNIKKLEINSDEFESFSVTERKLTKQKLDHVSR